MNRILLILLIAVLAVVCITGCNKSADAPRTTEGSAESKFRDQMADAKVKEISVDKNLVLEAPVEVKGTKVLSGEGSITAVGDKWAEDDYMIVLSSDSQLTVEGSITINASHKAGGVHVAQTASWSMNGGSLMGARGHNVYNLGEVIISNGEIVGSGEKYAGVYSEGTLTQNGGCIRDAYNNVSVLSGSFTFNGGMNQNSLRDGVHIAEGATLSVTSKDATITGSGVRGIYLFGTATIENITLNTSGDTLVKVGQTGTLNLKGGTLADSGYHAVENAGKMVMTGGVVRNSYNCGIVNTGTLELTGGSIMDNLNNKAMLNKHNGTATVSGSAVMFSGNRYAIANQDTASLDLTGADLLLSTVTNVYAYDGTVNIHDISLGASGSNNVRIYKADVTMNNVQVWGNSSSGSNTTHGILLEGGVLNAKDLTIKNTTGYGIRNKGGLVTAENVLISKSTKAGGIYCSAQDFTGVGGEMNVKNLTIEEIRYNNVVVDGGTVTITDGILSASGTNNTKVAGGKLVLKNVDILGNQKDTDGRNHALYATGGTLEMQNVKITDGKFSGMRVDGDTAVITGTNITIANSGEYGIDLTRGYISLNYLTTKGNHYNIAGNKGTIKLNNADLGATKSNNVRINSGTAVLNNVVIRGHVPDHVKTVHALFINDGNVTGKNITVQNVSDVGLRVKGGTTNIEGLTVKDAGADAVWISDGKATVTDLVVEKAGSAGVSATGTGNIKVVGGNIKNTKSHGVKSENDASLTLENIHVDTSLTDGRYAVLAQGGDVNLKNLEITGVKENITGAGIRINRDASHVIGDGISISGVDTGISASAGTADISGLITDNVASHSVYVSKAADLVISNATFGVTGTNNAKAESGGKLTLNNVVVDGTRKNHGLMVENGGYLYGKNITVRNTTGSAVRVKCSDAGNVVEIDGLVTENIGLQNIHINKDKDAENVGSILVKNGDLCRTSSHSVLVEAGVVTINNTKIQGHVEDTANNIHAIYVSSATQKLVLENIEVLDSAGDALRISAGEVLVTDFTSQQTGRYGVWADGGKLTAQNITISGSKIGVYATGGAMVLSGADISDSTANNINVYGAEVTVNGYVGGGKSQIGKAKADNIVANNGGIIRLNQTNVLEAGANNIVTTGGMIYMENSSVTGGDYSVLVQEKGYAELKDVTITDSVKDGIRVNRADGKVVMNGNVQISGPARYGISAEKGAVVINGDLTIHSDVKKSRALYAYSGGSIISATDAKVDIRGTEYGVYVETDGIVELANVAISGTAKAGVNMSAGTVQFNGINIADSGANNIYVAGGELTVNGYADGSKSQVGAATEDNIRSAGAGVIRLNKVNVLSTAKNNVVAIDGGTIHMTESSVTGGGHSVLTQDGKVVLTNVNIFNSATSAIRANRAGSTVEATDVVIDGAKTGLSVERGTVGISNITIRNTKEVGVSVIQGTSAANVTLTNLVTENCGTNAIYTSGADAKLTITGATLSNDGSDHVINLNGGPMVLNDVTIRGENLASGKYELYSGAGWLTIGGKMDADIYIATNPGRVIKVNKELTGNQLSVDWKNTPTGNALEFVDANMMNACKDNIRLGATQSALVESLTFENRYAKLVINVVTSESQLLDYLNFAASQNMTEVTVRIGGSFDVANQITVPAAITKLTICDDGNTATGNTITYSGNTDGMFVVHDNLKLTVKDISMRSTQKTLLKHTGGELVVQNCSLSSVKRGIHMTGGTAVVNGVHIADGSTNSILVSDGELTVNGYADGKKSQIGTSTEDNVRVEGAGVVRLNNVNVLASAKNTVVAINGGTIRMTNATVNGGNHSVLADKDGKVYLNNVSIAGSTTSGIRANNAGSYVEATDVTIDGAKIGLSFQSGTVNITNITIRNTKEVGVYVAQANADANVTLNNLVTENCGTHAVYTSGAAAKLTINGATLSNDGSDHVINLNGGPMVLNDVTIRGENLASGKYELYSGAGWLTIGGAMDIDVYIATNPGRVIKVNKELTGNNLVVDWKNAPTGNAFEFATEAIMNASKDNITLGKTQTNAGKQLYYTVDGTKAVAIVKAQ